MKSGSMASYRSALSGTGADIGGERDDETQIVTPGGGIQAILECGHDVSNRDTALESGTVFCRLCDLQGRCRDAERQEKELYALLEEANSLCRSAYSIAQRDGKETNWEAFRAKLVESLERQHKAMYPPKSQGEFRA